MKGISCKMDAGKEFDADFNLWQEGMRIDLRKGRT